MSTPDEFTSPQPSSNAGPLAQVWPRLIDYFVSNVISTVWSVFLFVGGLVFLRYFSSIGFMPELDLQASLTFLAALALTGGFIVILSMFTFFIPGLLWRIITSNNEKLKVLWHDGEQFVLWRALLWIGLPFVGIVGSWFSSNFLPRSVIVDSLIIWSVFLCLLILGYFLLRKKPLYNIPCIMRRRVATVWLLGHLISAATFPLVILVLSLLISLVPNLSKNERIVFLGVAALVVAVFNAQVATAPLTPQWKQHSLIIIPLLTLILMVGNNFIPRIVMSLYKFGNITNSSLILNEIGCTIVQHHGVKVTPYTPNPKTDTTPNLKTCSLSMVTILSRLGKTYYLEVPHTLFTIPTENVLSWTINKPQNVGIAGPSASPGF